VTISQLGLGSLLDGGPSIESLDQSIDLAGESMYQSKRLMNVSDTAAATAVDPDSETPFSYKQRQMTARQRLQSKLQQRYRNDEDG